MQGYPATQHGPTQTVDLSDQSERKRLSEGALRAFLNMVRCWNIKDEDARKLLGGIASGTYHNYKNQPDRTLDQDKLMRISYLTGIFKALNSLHGEELADKWVSMPNNNRIFAGQTPLDYMIKGGMPSMQKVRRLLDARRAGP